MSFGGSKNPPWQRHNLSNAGQQNLPPSIQAQMGLINSQLVNFQQNQPFNNPNIGLSAQTQQQNMSIISQMGGNLGNQLQQNQIFTQAVTYPTPRTINPVPFQNINSQPPPQIQQQQLQQQQQQQQQNHHHQSQQNNQNNQSQNQSNLHSNLQSILNKNIRTFSGTGTVSKIQNDFGFIDDEIYFHKNVCVKGMSPKIGDRVLVEANYTPSMAFKWNATRIQVLTSAPNIQRNYPPSGGMNMKNSGYNAVPPPITSSSSNDNGNFNNRSNRNRNLSPPQRRPSPDRHPRSRDIRKDVDNDELDRKRRRDDRDKDRERDRYRERRDHSIEKRERSPVRRSSPKRRKTRVVPRYMVQIPKVNLTMSNADILELRRRYSNLYIPSDFFCTQISWINAFPPNAPFSLQKQCSFHIMHKDVEPIENFDCNDPSDADYLYSAKVMLMGIPHISEIYQKCFATAEEKDRDDERDFVHPTRLINFLVGIRGKNETMAIGGPWSKSLDGDNPVGDTSVLIKTAIRTCKALTGIDLSNCTQWYRFVELFYHRSETIHKGRLIPARIETVVIFLPDVRSCIPTLIEWDEQQILYKRALENARNQNSETSQNTDNIREADKTTSNATLLQQETVDNVRIENLPNPSIQIKSDDLNVAAGDAETDAVPIAVENDDEANVAANAASVGNDKDDNTENLEIKKEPTPYTELDPKSMKVGDLRDELNARNLSAKGLRAQLVARLSKALRSESDKSNDKESIEDDSTNALETEEVIEIELEVIDAIKTDEIEIKQKSKSISTDIITPEPEKFLMNMMVIDEYDATKIKSKEIPKKRLIDDKDYQILEKRYALPSTPHIIVHPSRTAKSGKFDCTVMSLSLLLDYRPEDTKEHSFEVSLFAELFNEMLMRDFGFNIYKALYSLPEKPKDELIKKEEDTLKKDEKIKVDENNENLDDEGKKKEPPRNKSVSRDKEREQDNQRDNKPRSKHHDDDNSDDDENSTKNIDRKKNKDRDRTKYITSNFDLLLSFVYFDQTHCGYIFEKDIEDLFYTLGLNLSRAQTRKLVGKVISRDSLYYRKLTDTIKENDDDDDNDNKDGIIDDNNDINKQIFINEIIKNNKFNFQLNNKNDNNIKDGDDIKNELNQNDIPESLNGKVFFNGGLIDIEKLMEQMKRSEKAREDTEQILVDLRKQNNDLNVNYTKSQNKIKDLTSDLKSCNRKLCDTDQSLNGANKKIGDYYSILSNMYDKLTPIFSKSDKGGSSRNGSSRDRERERERDRDREKDESKESSKTEVDVKKEREK